MYFYHFLSLFMYFYHINLKRKKYNVRTGVSKKDDPGKMLKKFLDGFRRSLSLKKSAMR